MDEQGMREAYTECGMKAGDGEGVYLRMSETLDRFFCARCAKAALARRSWKSDFEYPEFAHDPVRLPGLVHFGDQDWSKSKVARSCGGLRESRVVAFAGQPSSGERSNLPSVLVEGVRLLSRAPQLLRRPPRSHRTRSRVCA